MNDLLTKAGMNSSQAIFILRIRPKCPVGIVVWTEGKQGDSLSVIVLSKDKGKSYIKHQTEWNGVSYKAKLCATIDRLLSGCHNLEELLKRLSSIIGYISDIC